MWDDDAGNMGTKRIGLSPNANHKTGQLNTYEIFMGVIASVVMDGDTIIKTVIHLSDPQTTILELLGSERKKYYV